MPLNTVNRSVVYRYAPNALLAHSRGLSHNWMDDGWEQAAFPFVRFCRYKMWLSFIRRCVSLFNCQLLPPHNTGQHGKTCMVKWTAAGVCAMRIHWQIERFPLNECNLSHFGIYFHFRVNSFRNVTLSGMYKTLPSRCFAQAVLSLRSSTFFSLNSTRGVSFSAIISSISAVAVNHLKPKTYSVCCE